MTEADADIKLEPVAEVDVDDELDDSSEPIRGEMSLEVPNATKYFSTHVCPSELRKRSAEMELYGYTWSLEAFRCEHNVDDRDVRKGDKNADLIVSVHCRNEVGAPWPAKTSCVVTLLRNGGGNLTFKFMKDWPAEAEHSIHNCNMLSIKALLKKFGGYLQEDTVRIRCSVLVLPTRHDGSIANPHGETIVNSIDGIEALNETTLNDVKQHVLAATSADNLKQLGQPELVAKLTLSTKDALIQEMTKRIV